MTDVRGARIVRLMDDPQIGGDLLLVAIALAAKYDLGWDYGGTVDAMADRLWPTTAKTRSWYIRNVFKSDMRTYCPPSPNRHCCTAPMIRRDNECGRAATTWGHVTDWDTGERTYIGACSRHYAWFNATDKAGRQARPANPPLPCANHGGLLVPHFPRLDWPAFWARLDPNWVEHPEAKPFPKPDLALVLGDGEGGLAVAPLLSVVPIGGAS